MTARTGAPRRNEPTRVTRRRGTLVVSVILSLLPATATMADAHPKTYEAEGHCRQLAAFLPVRAEDVREFVPPAFPIIGEQAGAAELLVTGGRCEPWIIDDVERQPFTFGLVGVRVGPPGPGLPGGRYDIWWFSDESTFHAKSQRLGMFSRLLEEISFEVQTGPLGQVIAAAVSVPWEPSPYTIDAVIADAPGPDSGDSVGGPSTHWYLGRHGLVLSEHDNTHLRPAAADLVVRAPAGSPLARMMGGSEIAFAGLYLEFRATAVTGVVEG